MASVFGDESSDEKAERVMAVAALVGTDDQWDAFVPAWQEITGREEFHAAEWESEYAEDPDRTKHQRRLLSYRLLTELLIRSGLRGWGVGIDLAGYRAYFPGITQDMAYSRCFIGAITGLVQTSVNVGHKDLKFTFDGRQGSGTTALLYDYITSQPEWQGSILFADEISFGNRKNPRIQAADLFARETMKELDRLVTGEPRPRRKSLTALASAEGRFQFEYLMKEFFEGMTSQMSELGKIAGFSEDDYDAWLQKHGAQHNLNSMHRFLLWFDAEELRKKNEKR